MKTHFYKTIYNGREINIPFQVYERSENLLNNTVKEYDLALSLLRPPDWIRRYVKKYGMDNNERVYSLTDIISAIEIDNAIYAFKQSKK